MGLFTFPGSKKGDYFSSTIYSSARTYSISEEQAMQIPAVKASVDLIASTVSQLPVYLYKELENGDINTIKKDSRIDLLNESMNQRETSAKIKRLLIKDLLFYGKAYLLNRYDQFFYLKANQVHPDFYTKDDLTIAGVEYRYDSPNASVILSEDEVISFDVGTEGVLVDGDQILQQAFNELDYSKNVMKNGALPVGVLKAASRLTEPAINRLRESWENLYGGSKNSSKTLILEEGLDYTPISLNPNDLQLNESAKTTLASVARLFNVPESMVNSLANKYGSLEMNNLHFLQYTVGPLINVIETTLNKELLDESEKIGGIYFRFDTSEVLRTTEKQKVETTIQLVKNGIISENEGRSRLDYKRIEKDYFTLNMASALKDVETGDITVINLGETIKQEDESDEDGDSRHPNDLII
ncbi:phage portal protein [Halobacillus litoralis]|uniref:Phage portal protein n=1 Tax=Halobacillus litoralis TaxID=45668 RepID=A0A410MAX4_9BACI|nr:phage portal protein [Halobacillus litoralis]QAS51830.1 phage portal protein [Halobacillus litoralis]